MSTFGHGRWWCGVGHTIMAPEHELDRAGAAAGLCGENLYFTPYNRHSTLQGHWHSTPAMCCA
ncbi:hypothetical protein ACLK1U_09250 [Escherichia coli]